MKQITIIVLLSILTISCAKEDALTSTNLVAKVYDFELTKDELKANVITSSETVDSLTVTKDYIKRWSRQKLLYRNALINLDETSEIDRLVKKYKEELYISYYKKALVGKKLDTFVFESEIDSFYVNNKNNFKLNEDLVEFKYIHITKNNKDRYKIKKLFTSASIDDKQDILTNYKGYDDFYFNDSTWVSLKNIYSRKISFPKLSSYDLSRTNRLIEKRGDNQSLYYIFINNVAKKGDTAPLIYIRPTIKNILLHKNKIKFFDQMEQILIDDAVKQKKYEVY